MHSKFPFVQKPALDPQAAGSCRSTAVLIGEQGPLPLHPSPGTAAHTRCPVAVGGGYSHGKVSGEISGRGRLGAPHLAAESLIFMTNPWSRLISLGESWGRAGSGGSLWGSRTAGLRSASPEACSCAEQPLTHGGTCSRKVDPNCLPLTAREFLPRFTLRCSASEVNETFIVLQRTGCVWIRWWPKVNKGQNCFKIPKFTLWYLCFSHCNYFKER